jgi:hypothetical protein
MKQYTLVEYEKMVADIETELKKSLDEAKSESTQPLAKSEESSEPKKEEEKKDESPAEEKQEAKDESDKKEDKKDDDHGYDEEDMEEMHKMYASMSKAEQKAHCDSLQKAMQACEPKEEPKMEKSEEIQTQPVVVSEPSKEADLLKSEVETVKKENQELKKSIEGLVSAMNTFVTKKPAPARKAITDIDYIKKSEESNDKTLSKSEVVKILNKKAQEPNLSRADREAINAFCLNTAGLEKIKHLLVNQ